MLYQLMLLLILLLLGGAAVKYTHWKRDSDQVHCYIV